VSFDCNRYVLCGGFVTLGRMLPNFINDIRALHLNLVPIVGKVREGADKSKNGAAPASRQYSILPQKLLIRNLYVTFGRISALSP